MSDKLKEIVGKMTPGPWSEKYTCEALRHFRKTGCDIEDIGLDETAKFPNDHLDPTGIVTLRNVADELLAIVEAARELRRQCQREFPVCPDAEYVDAVGEALNALDSKLEEN